MSDILVVASKVKQYIKEKSQMSTSSNTLSALSEAVKSLCDQAIARAQADGRKTVMDRDVSPSPSSTSS